MFRRVWLTFLLLLFPFFFRSTKTHRYSLPLVLATNTALRHPQSLGPRSMPQVVPLLPIHRKPCSGLSAATRLSCGRKARPYLSKLIKIPEVWRSPEMANFLDDSAKVLANLTVDLRVERVVHLHGSRVNAKDAKDQEKEPSQKAREPRGAAFTPSAPWRRQGSITSGITCFRSEAAARL